MTEKKQQEPAADKVPPDDIEKEQIDIYDPRPLDPIDTEAVKRRLSRRPRSQVDTH